MSRTLAPCGTYAAAMRHYHGEALCEPCLQAKQERDRIAVRKYRASGRAKDDLQSAAWRAAERRLRDRHSDEWNAIYVDERRKVGLP